MTIGIGIGIWVGLWGSLLVPQQTVLTARFNTPGPVTLPSWLTYTCASTSTVRTGLSTVLKGIAVNQAVANIYGLQVECTSTNYCLQSDNFNTAVWTNDAGTRSFLQTDPYGGQAGCKIQGASYGLHQILAQASTVFSVSSYYVRSGATNSSACVVLRTSSVILTSFVENPVQSESYQRTEKTYNGVSVTSANLWFQNSDYGGAINSNCTFAFPQVELLPFSTSYIPTGATAVTRAAGILKATLPDCTDMVFDYEFVASHGPNVGAPGDSVSVHCIGASSTAWFGTENSSSKFRMTTPGGSPLGTVVLSWTAGDVVRFVVTLTYVTNSVAYQCFVNGAKIADETVALAAGMATLASNSVHLFTTSAGTQHASPRGIRRITITPLQWSTVNATSFNQPGVATLPAWLSFTCASTRTAEVTPSTLLKGVAVNQVVVNRWGLQHETTDTNSAVQSENPAAWAFTGTHTDNQTDPSGGTTASLINGLANNVGATTSVSKLIALAGTVSAWIRTSGHASVVIDTQPYSNPLSGIQIPAGNGDVWGRYAKTLENVTVVQPGYTVIMGEARGTYTVDTSATTGTYTNIMQSDLPYATSYIPTTTTAVTRAPSILKATLPDVTDIKVTLSFVASHAPTVVMGAVTIFLGNRANNATYVGYQDSTGKLVVSTPGGQVYSVGVLSWAAGDNVSIDILPRYTSKTTSFVVRVNGVQVLAETLTSVDAPKFDATQVNVGAGYTGTYHLSPKGLVSLSVAVPATPQPPGNFGTLLAAWDARYNVTKTGNNVTAWTPYLGDASIVLNGTATYVADRGDGKPELSFDGVSQVLSSVAANLGTIPLGAYALVIVGAHGTPSYMRVLSLTDSATNRAFDLYNTSPSVAEFQAQDAGVAYTPLPFAHLASRGAVVLDRVATALRAYASKNLSVSASVVAGSALGAAPNRLSVGAYNGGSNFSAVNISAIYLFKSDLGGREISAAAMATHPTNYPVI